MTGKVCVRLSVVILVGLLGLGVTFSDWNRSAAGGAKTPPVYRSPFWVVATNGKVCVSDRTAKCVVVLDAAQNRKIGEIPVRGEPTGLAISRDGRRLYVSEYGAGSVAVIVTDKLGNGPRVTPTAVSNAAPISRVSVGLRPMGLALAEKANLLFVCNTDVHNLSVIDTKTLKEVKRVPMVREPQFAAVTPDESSVVVGNGLSLGRATDPDLAADVSIVDVKSLSARHIKLPSGSTNLRGVCVSPDGKWAYVVHCLGHFNVPPTQLERGWINTNALSIIDLNKSERYATVLLDNLSEGAADPCGVARSADGFNWDLLNDGLGNPKNNKSMLFAPRTPPMMSRRVREDPEIAIRQGFRVILLTEPTQEQVDAVLAYLNSLQPEPSPHRTRDGKLTAAAKRGQALFEGKARCAGCHPAPLYTDLKAHDVGTKSDNDPDGLYDTPTLVEVYRTAPYLHDGRAATLKEVFAVHNKNDRHGKTSHLTPQELDDLVAYLLSL